MSFVPASNGWCNTFYFLWMWPRSGAEGTRGAGARDVIRNIRIRHAVPFLGTPGGTMGGMNDTHSGGAETASSIDKAFLLIRAFDRRDSHGVGVSELARRAGLSKSTAHRILGTLIENHAVQKVGDRYRIGPLFLEREVLTESKRHELITETLTPFLAALFEHTRHSVHLAYLDGADTVYANKLFSVRGVSAPSRIGGRVPGYTTGVGKAIMAYDDAAVDLAVSRGLVPWTPHSVSTAEELRHELAVVRDKGVAYDLEEIAVGLSCIAAPVWGRGPVPAAAMSVSGPTETFRAQDHQETLLKICASAGRAMRIRERQEAGAEEL